MFSNEHPSPELSSFTLPELAPGIVHVLLGYAQLLLVFISLLPAIDNGSPRLTYVELFAGDSAWSAGTRLFGYVGKSVDINIDSSHDFMQPSGFLIALALVMGAHVGAILHAGCPCSTWVYMSRFTTGRHIDIMGDVGKMNVVQANAMVARLVYILILCIKRGVYWTIEQPSSSVLFKHPRWEYLQRRFSSIIFRCDLDLGLYSYTCVKRTLLIGTAPYLGKLAYSKRGTGTHARN